jgi:hypothetical protein
MRIIFEIETDQDKTEMRAFFRSICRRDMALEITPDTSPRNTTLPSLKPASENKHKGRKQDRRTNKPTRDGRA